MNIAPNLTLDYCGGKNVNGDNGPYEWYVSLLECSEKRNIPFKVLLYTKKQQKVPHNGFVRNGCIKWNELQPYLKEHYFEFLASCPKDTDEESREVLELRKLKAEVVKLENFNKSRSKDFVSRRLVLKTINEMVMNTSAVLRRWLEQEQPFKCEGMSALKLQQMNKDILIQLFTDMKNCIVQVEQCNDLKDIEETINATT